MYDNLMRPFPTPELDRLHVQLRQVQTSEHTPLDAATVYNVLDTLPELYTYALDVHCRTVLDRTRLQSLVAPIFEHFFQTVALCPPRLRQLAIESLPTTPLHQTLLTEFVAQNPILGDDNSFNATLDSIPNNLFQTMAYHAVSECHAQECIPKGMGAHWYKILTPDGQTACPPNIDSLTYAVDQFADGLPKDALDRMKPHLLEALRSMACAMLRVFQLEHAQHALEGSSNQDVIMAIKLLKNTIQEPAIQIKPLETQTLS